MCLLQYDLKINREFLIWSSVKLKDCKKFFKMLGFQHKHVYGINYNTDNNTNKLHGSRNEVLPLCVVSTKAFVGYSLICLAVFLERGKFPKRLCSSVTELSLNFF